MRLITLAWKNLHRRRARSLATAAGVVLAVGSMVAFVGLSEGLRASFAELLELHGVDLLVFKAGASQRLTSVFDERIGDRLRAVPGVRAVVPALVDFAALGESSVGVPINGWEVDSPLFGGLTVARGRRLRPGDRRAVMIGRTLADRLGKGVGDTVEIELEGFRVVCIYESMNIFENGAAILLLPEMQELLDRAGKVTAFSVRLDPAPDRLALAERVRGAIAGLRDDRGGRLPIESLPTREFIATTGEFGIARGIAWMTSAVALLVSSLGIFNTMTMAVFERTDELGLLHAIGWRPARIVGLVLLESLLLSPAGSILGSAAAVGLIRALGRMQGFDAVIAGSIAPAVVIQGAALGLFLGTMGGLYPALRAGKITPSEALRHA